MPIHYRNISLAKVDFLALILSVVVVGFLGSNYTQQDRLVNALFQFINVKIVA